MTLSWRSNYKAFAPLYIGALKKIKNSRHTKVGHIQLHGFFYLYSRNTSDFYSENAIDPFRQKQGVALLILRCHISGKIYSTSESSCELQI